MQYKDEDIVALKAYFKSKKSISIPIQLDAGQRIIDVEKFLETQYAILEGRMPAVAGPSYDRLMQLKKYFEQQD